MNIKQKNIAFITRCFVPIILLFLLFTSSVSAQKKRVLRSHDNMKRLEALQPETITNRANIEDFIQRTQRRIVPLKDVTIPVVFHILYKDNSEKINEDQVMSQLEALNRDFGNPPITLDHPALEKEKFIERINQMTIQFCLPELKGNLKDSSAINFHPVNRQEWGMDDAMKTPEQGGISPWNTDKFLNVWVVNLADSVSGYAQLPGGPSATDGIVIDYDFLGTRGTVTAPYDLGKTMVHLVGNYLGLHSLWGETICADDYVFDTPIHNAPNYNCPDYKHFSICRGEVEMTMNFMDNSNDECLQLFTTGQVYRLHSFLSPGAPRAKLRNTKTACQEEVVSEEIAAEQREQKDADEFTKDIQPNRLKIFPNPARNNINIEFQLIKETTIDLIVTDLNGKLITSLKQINPATGSLNLNTSSWIPGIYLVSIKQDEKEVITEKLVIGNKK